MENIKRVKHLVAYYTKLYGTSNPFVIADQLGILYQIGHCKHEGCYMFLKNHRYIFLDQDMDQQELQVVMAHELGHALLDRKTNCYFIRNKTLFLTSKFERRANLFAAHLLISDELLQEYAGCTKEQFCRCTGIPKELLELRLR